MVSARRGESRWREGARTTFIWSSEGVVQAKHSLCRQANKHHMLICVDGKKFSVKVVGQAVLPAALGSCCKK